MSHDDTPVSLNISTALVEKLDTIAKLKYLNREDVIIDACAYYCQFYDMNSERFPETMRGVFFNLARHDDEFRALLRKVVKEITATENNSP